MKPRTRFAPSPTGALHIGGARTALFSFLYARRHQGEFVLRIEDTDRERSTERSTASILDDLQWLGITHDEGPFYQSKRRRHYLEAVERLLEKGMAYRCYCTREELERMRSEQRAAGQKPRYDGRCRNRKGPPAETVRESRFVVRFRTPFDGCVVFRDLVHGQIEIANTELDDLVLLREDGTPTYNLTVAIDDADMGITHVIRGDDHLNNTPRQIHIFRALGLAVPFYAHLPMILGQDGSRMSKRSGAAAIATYRQEGYLPQAILNYMVRLGWSSGNRELFSLDEMIEAFSLEAINLSAASLDPEKLGWLNQHYLNTLPVSQVLPLFEAQLGKVGFDVHAKSAPQVFEALRSRYKTLKDMAMGSAFVYADSVDSTEDNDRMSKLLNEQTTPLLALLLKKLEVLDSWAERSISQSIDETLTESGSRISRLGPPLRFVVTGGAPAPGLAQTLVLVGRDRCIRRLRIALEQARGS